MQNMSKISLQAKLSCLAQQSNFPVFNLIPLVANAHRLISALDTHSHTHTHTLTIRPQTHTHAQPHSTRSRNMFATSATSGPKPPNSPRSPPLAADPQATAKAPASPQPQPQRPPSFYNYHSAPFSAAYAPTYQSSGAQQQQQPHQGISTRDG